MLLQLIDELKPKNVGLVAVSKTRPAEQILELHEQGQRIFGENRAPEMKDKHEQLPKDIEWHMIGHLQANKVKYIAPFVHMIHSVDDLGLLKEIDKRAAQHDRCINYLLQFHVATEQTKTGLSLEKAEEMLQSADFKALKNTRPCGVMGMATFTDDKSVVKKEFRQLKQIFDQIKQAHFEKDDAFKEISMGMSGDYALAVEEGSTLVRIGSLLFGKK